MSKPRPKSRSLSCTAVDFVEVEFPQSITPRLVLQFTEGISILLEKPDGIVFASEFVATVRERSIRRGVRGEVFPGEASPEDYSDDGDLLLSSPIIQSQIPNVPSFPSKNLFGTSPLSA